MDNIVKGSIISIKKGATYYNTDKLVPNWVQQLVWYVKDVVDDRVIIDKDLDGDYSINSPVRLSDVMLYVKEYRVVKDIPYYLTAQDAENKINSYGTYTKGIYYVYNKYLKGYNKMYNITPDVTGSVPGNWINPSENIIESASPYGEDITPIIGYNSKDDEINKTKAYNKIKSNNSDFDINIVNAFFSIAPKYKINPLIAISQSILETGWFKFIGSSVKYTQNNFCGLGAVGNGEPGLSFDTIEDGVTAQCQHLYAYGCINNLPNNEILIDSRFKYVERGCAKYWEDLSGRWALAYDRSKYKTATEAIKARATYGQKIIDISRSILDFEESKQDTPTNDNVEKEKVQVSLGNIIKFIKKIIKYILGLNK